MPTRYSTSTDGVWPHASDLAVRSKDEGRHVDDRQNRSEHGEVDVREYQQKQRMSRSLVELRQRSS